MRKFAIGDEIETTDGPGIIIGREVLINGDSDPTEQEHVVYNLEMKDGPHNYIVNQAIVHNNGNGGGGSGGAK